MMLAEFHNALRILTSIDRYELVAFKVLDQDDGDAWHAFRTDPFRWFIRADDEQAERLWRIIQARQNRTMAA